MKLFLWIFGLALLVALVGGVLYFGVGGSSPFTPGAGIRNPDLPILPEPTDAPGKTSIVIPPKAQ